jgi:hypothetical protein
MANFTTLAITAIIASIVTLSTMGLSAFTSAVAQSMADNATMAGNMTAGNVTAGNITADNANLTAADGMDSTGSISGCRKLGLC